MTNEHCRSGNGVCIKTEGGSSVEYHQVDDSGASLKAMNTREIQMHCTVIWPIHHAKHVPTSTGAVHVIRDPLINRISNNARSGGIDRRLYNSPHAKPSTRHQPRS